MWLTKGQSVSVDNTTIITCFNIGEILVLPSYPEIPFHHSDSCKENLKPQPIALEQSNPDIKYKIVRQVSESHI